MVQVKRTANGLQTSTIWGNWDNGTYRGALDLLSQDSQNVYYGFNREYGGYYSYIGQYNKTTGGGSNVNINTGTIQLLKDVSMYLYVYAPSVNANNVNVGKYNKLNNTFSWIFQENFGTTGYQGDALACDMDSNGVFFIAKDGITFGKTDHFIVYRKYILNTNLDTVAGSTVTVDMSLLSNNNIYNNSQTNNMNVCNQLFRFTDQNTGKKYMNHLIYNKGSRYSNNVNPLDSALYTYEMISDDNWKLVSYKLFNPIIYRAFLPCVNGRYIMLAYENAAHVYMWDTGTTSYIKVSGFEQTVEAIGCDTNNNMYVQYADTSIELVSKTMPTTIYADFDQDVYTYNGFDVNANIVVNVKNFQGKFVSTKVTLTLYGNVKFTQNNTKTITVTTSNLDNITVPVTIYDEGNYQVVASLV
jgi:hypothetical protein